METQGLLSPQFLQPGGGSSTRVNVVSEGTLNSRAVAVNLMNWILI